MALKKTFLATGLLVGVVLGCAAEPPTKLEQVEILMTDGAYAEAEAMCDAEIQARPDDPDGLVLRGRIKMADRRFASAEQDFKQAIELDPQEPEAYYQLARIYRQREDWEQADHCSNLAQKYDPRNHFFYGSEPGIRDEGPSRERHRKATSASDDWNSTSSRPAPGTSPDDHAAAPHDADDRALRQRHQARKSQGQGRADTSLGEPRPQSGSRQAPSSGGRTELGTARKLGRKSLTKSVQRSVQLPGSARQAASSSSRKQPAPTGVPTARRSSDTSGIRSSQGTWQPASGRHSVMRPEIPRNGQQRNGTFGFAADNLPTAIPYGTRLSGGRHTWPANRHPTTGQTWTPLTSAPTPSVLRFRLPDNTGSSTPPNASINTGNVPYPRPAQPNVTRGNRTGSLAPGSQLVQP